MSATAVVTGGGRGIGKAITAQLLNDGVDVLLLELEEEFAQQTCAELEETAGEGRITFNLGSVASAADVTQAFDKAEKVFGRPVQLLVNNAGGGVQICLVQDTTEDLWDKVLDINLKGVFLCLREFARRLINNKLGGSAVNITSLNHKIATDGLGAYCAAKAGVAQLTKVCASEWGQYGIRVNCVAPGVIGTPPVRQRKFLEGESGERFMGRTPLGRFGVPDDIAQSVSFLLSENASWVTGTTLGVDGGQGVRGLPPYPLD